MNSALFFRDFTFQASELKQNRFNWECA